MKSSQSHISSLITPLPNLQEFFLYGSNTSACLGGRFSSTGKSSRHLKETCTPRNRTIRPVNFRSNNRADLFSPVKENCINGSRSFSNMAECFCIKRKTFSKPCRCFSTIPISQMLFTDKIFFYLSFINHY